VTPGTAPTLQDLLRFKLLMMLLLPTFGKPYRLNETNKLYIYNFKINEKFTDYTNSYGGFDSFITSVVSQKSH
jgi:hypothetical protein